jgi:RimK family alpha-L-glutamate ligase
VRVWNDARAIERCVDKSTTTFLLHKAGIPTPRTRTMETKPPADTYVAGAERPLIFKPLFGSQGKGLLRVDDVAGLPAAEAADNIYYLQDFVPPSGPSFEDWRVIVTRSRVVAAMTRRAGNWITNVHQGGEPSAHEPSEEMAQLASGALTAVGADYGGVDLIRTPDGRLLVLEVNSNPSWRGLQSVSDINIAEMIVEDFLLAVAEHRRRTSEPRSEPCPA